LAVGNRAPLTVVERLICVGALGLLLAVVLGTIAGATATFMSNQATDTPHGSYVWWIGFFIAMLSVFLVPVGAVVSLAGRKRLNRRSGNGDSP